MSADPDAPIRWLCTFAFTTTRPPFRRETVVHKFDTEAEARAKHDDLKQQFGDHVVAVVTPVYARHPPGDTVAARRRSLDALGLPRQLSSRAAERAARKAAKRPPPPKPRHKRHEGDR
jgi:hypothetical protein